MTIAVGEVQTLLTKMKPRKSPGRLRIIDGVWETTGTIITIMFKKSMEEFKVPTSWKKDGVTQYTSKEEISKNKIIDWYVLQ